MRLRRCDPSVPGIRRVRCGRGFRYEWERTGDRVVDGDTLDRIRSLVLPPAWRDVWICPWPNGHIQAVGTDDAGRRQYRYHDAWRRRRDAEKFARAVELGAALPAVRKAVAADLRGNEVTERRVLAAAVRLLDIGCFRIGSEEYARDHETFGIATLRKDHVSFADGQILFEYPAKGSVTRCLSVREPAVEDVLQVLRRRRSGGDQLLAYRTGGGWVDVHSADINRYVKDLAGPHFSAKDFRTWTGTVFAAAQFALVDPVPRASARRRAVAAVVRETADYLGNTPAVCRASYIDPRVVDHFDEGETIADHGWPGRRRDLEGVRLAAERALLSMLGGRAAAAAA